MKKIVLDKKLFIVLVCFFCSSFVYSICTPIFEYPDEQGHVTVISYIVENKKLPVLSPDSLWLHEGYNPPLYHVILALEYSLIGKNHFTVPVEPNIEWGKYDPRVFLLPEEISFSTILAFQFLRCTNILFAIAILLVVNKLAKEVFPDSNKAWQTVFFIAFLPQFTWLSGSINPDIFLAFFSTLSIYFLNHILRENKLIDYILLGICVGLGLLTKYPMVLFLPITIGIAVYKNRLDYKRYSNLFVSLAIIFVLAGWLYLRNFILYQEWIPFSLYQQLYASLSAHNNIVSLSFWVYFFISIFTTFFGEFDHGYFFLPAWIYGLYVIFTSSIVIGLVTSWFRGKKEFYWLSIFLLIANLSIVLMFALNSSAIVQGRFFFPIISLWGLGVVEGLRWWTTTKPKVVSIVISLYFLLNLYSLFFVLLPGYR